MHCNCASHKVIANFGKSCIFNVAKAVHSYINVQPEYKKINYSSADCVSDPNLLRHSCQPKQSKNTKLEHKRDCVSAKITSDRHMR